MIKRTPIELKLLDTILSETYKKEFLSISADDLLNILHSIPDLNNLLTQNPFLYISSIEFLDEEGLLLHSSEVRTVKLHFKGIHKMINGGYSREYKNSKINSTLQRWF